MNRWAAYPQLGGTSVNVRWLRTPSIGEPHLNGGKETYVEETGEAELPPIPPPLTGGHRPRRGNHPSPFHYPFSGVMISLFPRPHFLTRGVSRLPPYGIRGWVGISWLTAATPKTLHKIASIVKR
jgi:hypothetical protein